MLRRTLGLIPLLFVAISLAAPAGLRAADSDPLSFELYQDAAKEFRWRLRQGDDILGTAGQGYKDKASATKSIEAVKKGLENGKDTFEVYQDNAKAFRWRLKATNGQVVAAATKGQKTKGDAEKVTALISKEGPKATLVEAK
jgi:uncharacterized protein YegP (UPF0339 family)